MLKTKNIRYKYNDGPSFFYPDISCEKGDSVVILGESGVGKSTLLYILGGLLKPLSGEVIIDGVDICQLNGASLDSFRGQKIGIVFQKSHFISSLTVQENLVFTRKLAGLKVDKRRVEDILTRLAIPHKKNKYPEQLSQGEQQRFSIARALVTNPRLILADEPSSALDDKNCELMVNLLKEQAEEDGASLAIVTHDFRLSNLFTNKIELT
jgi:putative ABC transport system ATP-binding protein